MPEQEKMKAYITYVINDEIKKVLLKERVVYTSRVIIGDDAYNSRKHLPKVIIDDLIKTHQARIVPTERVTYESKEKIFDIPFTRSRTIQIDGDKYIQIRVLGNNIEELMKSISAIKSNMAQYGLREKLCIWNQIGKLNRKVAVKEQPKVKVDYDKEQVKKQKTLELVTIRDENNNGVKV